VVVNVFLTSTTVVLKYFAEGAKHRPTVLYKKETQKKLTTGFVRKRAAQRTTI